MVVSWLLLSVSLAGFVDISTSAADAVTLNDGTVIRGQVLDAARFQGLTVLVRRDWARSNVPGWMGRWERQENVLVLRGQRERRDRLIAWRKERTEADGTSRDRVFSWIDREVTRLTTMKPARTALTAATFPRSEVRSIQQQSTQTGRILRLAWLAGIGNAETLPIDELTSTLEARGRLKNPEDPAFVDALLPLYPETEDRWRIRRASTEVALESDLRSVQFRELTLPESNPEATPPPQTTTELIDSPAGRAAFGSIQAVTPFDSVRQQLDAIADRGRVGAIVTHLEFSVDSDVAQAEATFWVRKSRDRWEAVFTRKSSVSSNEPASDAPSAEPEGSPVKTALLVLETVASSPSSPETSQQRQRAGSIGDRALRRARLELDTDFAPFVLPIVAPRS